MSPSQRQSVPLRFALYALMVLLAVVFLFPFLFMLASSLITLLILIQQWVQRRRAGAAA